MDELFLISLVIAISPITLGGNVLMFVTFSSNSMKIVFDALAEEMIKRGHGITMVTSYVSKEPISGIREIALHDLKATFEDMADVFAPSTAADTGYSYAFAKEEIKAAEVTCDVVFANREVQNIIKGKEHYDLAILNLLYEDCSIGIVKKLNLPFLYVSSRGIPVEFTSNLRIPSCMNYCPMLLHKGYTNKMAFLERLENSFITLAVTWVRGYTSKIADDFIRRNLGDLPPVLEMEKNVSLIIVNDHFSVSYARPLLPNIVQAACLHCKPAQYLPMELEEWVKGSGDDGFIYFSLGSVVPAHLMPKELLETFVNVFAKVKQRVIWKINLDNIPNLPKNVKIFKWLPQQDLLGHPKLKLFMSHGGLLSVQESAYHGTPMLGFPTALDQPYNMRAVEDSGSGKMLNWEDITEERLLSVIEHMLSNPSYKQKAEIRKSVTRDVQNPPLDTAVYWIEYVLRHKGAPQLRTGGLDLTWYQYYQLDILAFLGFLILLFLLLVYWIGRVCRNVYKGTYKKKGLKKE